MEPMIAVNGQMEVSEKKRVLEKKEMISKIYESVPEDVQEYIPLERIYNSKWENDAEKEADIRKEIFRVARRVFGDVRVLKSINSEAVPEALEKYKRSLILTDAVAYISSYEQQKLKFFLCGQEKRTKMEKHRSNR